MTSTETAVVASTSTSTQASGNAPAKQPSSNWKALRKSMPVSIAAQELGGRPSKKRKRESETLSKPTNPADFIANGAETPEASTSDVKGKGKARKPLLGEEGVSGHKAEAGQYLSLDCEFVGLYDPANDHARHSLARVSIVNYHGAIVLDTFVAQRERIGDWRTWVSGVRPEDVQGAPSYAEVQKQVSELLKGRVLIGHAVHNDLKVLLLSHSYQDTRDTATYAPLRELAKTKRPSLKNLAKKALGIDIQEGEHSSVTDARATMAIYRTVQKEWEEKLRAGKPKKNKKLEAAKKSSSSAKTSDKIVRKEGGAKAKGGPGVVRKGGGSLGLAATLSKEKDWWSSGTPD